MMNQGRGSASVNKLSLWLALLCVLIQIGTNDAAVFMVGDGVGWSFSADSWSEGKSFRSGDELVFNYNPDIHNVVAVDASGYKNCQVPAGSRVYNSGNDHIPLDRGMNYFICSIPGHCKGGMKIAITAN
ncbi:Basic blue protein [Rhynchospora pubera]|uniref:Plantacyanin n=1 Tax=Rhynchospora pubera TaxID=906938 RepID=A0AAV8HQ81_9POAL|nr:Basic blue protein [Rhynchospora pubera]KAJ4820048.1 Basic blue protein [Rhynchospora pubera]